MSKKAAVDAILARLAANWTTSAILPLNEGTETPGDYAPWVRVQFPVTNNNKVALGPTFREDAAFRVVVATEIGSGLAKSNLWCEQIAAIFRGQKFDGVQCWAPTIREGVDEGNYFIAAVIVPFQFFYSD
jgi:hypothetical protein